MKIGIITFHFTTNQGAVLQCFALKKWLEKHGHEVQIINYRPPYHMVRYVPKKNPFMAARGTWRKNGKFSFVKRAYTSARSFARCLKDNKRQVDRAKYAKFTEFNSNYLNETKNYKSLSALQKDPPNMDLYISGSDQLWNPELLDATLDGAYFLNFGNKNTRKITYAVSAKEHYSEGEKQKLKELSRSLDAISIREANQDVVDSVNLPVHVCIDPTLLLDQADYLPLESKRLEPAPYLFVYGFENTEIIDHVVHTIADAMNLKIINGCPHRIRLTGECIKVYDYGPQEFLSYMANADYVVSNSFHATAFSIILQKPFVVVPHKTRGKRMIELLGKLGINERLWLDDECAWKTEIDYKNVKKSLLSLRKESEEYLLSQLEEVEKDVEKSGSNI